MPGFDYTTGEGLSLTDSTLGGPTPGEKSTDEAWEPDWWTGTKARLTRAGQGRFGEALDFSKDVRIPEEEQSYASHIPGVGALSAGLSGVRALGPGLAESFYRKSLGVDETAPFSYTDVPQAMEIRGFTPGVPNVAQNPEMQVKYSQAIEAWKAGDKETAINLMKEYKSLGGFTGGAMKFGAATLSDPSMALPFGAAGKTLGTLAGASMAPEMLEGTIRSGAAAAEAGWNQGITSPEFRAELPEFLGSAGFLGSMAAHHAGDIGKAYEWARTPRAKEAKMSTADAALAEPQAQRPEGDAQAMLAGDVEAARQMQESPYTPEQAELVTTTIQRALNMARGELVRRQGLAAQGAAGRPETLFDPGEQIGQVGQVLELTPEIAAQVAKERGTTVEKVLNNTTGFSANNGDIYIGPKGIRKILQTGDVEGVLNNIENFATHEGQHSYDKPRTKALPKEVYDPMTGEEVTGEDATPSGTGHSGGWMGDDMLGDISGGFRANQLRKLLGELPQWQSLKEELRNDPRLTERLYQKGTPLGARSRTRGVQDLVDFLSDTPEAERMPGSMLKTERSPYGTKRKSEARKEEALAAEQAKQAGEKPEFIDQEEGRPLLEGEDDGRVPVTDAFSMLQELGFSPREIIEGVAKFTKNGRTDRDALMRFAEGGSQLTKGSVYGEDERIKGAEFAGEDPTALGKKALDDETIDTFAQSIASRIAKATPKERQAGLTEILDRLVGESVPKGDRGKLRAAVLEYVRGKKTAAPAPERMTPPPGLEEAKPLPPAGPKAAGVPKTPEGPPVEKALAPGSRHVPYDVSARTRLLNHLAGLKGTLDERLTQIGMTREQWTALKNRVQAHPENREKYPELFEALLKVGQSTHTSRAEGIGARRLQLNPNALKGKPTPLGELPKSSQEGMTPAQHVVGEQGLTRELRTQAEEALTKGTPAERRALADKLDRLNAQKPTLWQRFLGSASSSQRADLERQRVGRANMAARLRASADRAEKKAGKAQAKVVKSQETQAATAARQQAAAEARKPAEDLKIVPPPKAEPKNKPMTAAEMKAAMEDLEFMGEDPTKLTKLAADKAVEEARKLAEEVRTRRAALEAEQKQMKRAEAKRDVRGVAVRTEDVAKGSRSGVVYKQGEVKAEKRKIGTTPEKASERPLQNRRIVGWEGKPFESEPIYEAAKKPKKGQKGPETALVRREGDEGIVREVKPEEYDQTVTKRTGFGGVRKVGGRLVGAVRSGAAKVFAVGGRRKPSAPGEEAGRGIEGLQEGVGAGRYHREKGGEKGKLLETQKSTGTPAELPKPGRPARQGLDEAQLLVEKYIGRHAKDAEGKVKGAGIMEHVKDARAIAEALGPENPEHLENWDVLPKELQTAIRRAYNARQNLAPGKPAEPVPTTGYRKPKPVPEADQYRVGGGARKQQPGRLKKFLAAAKARWEAGKVEAAERREQERTKTGPFTPGERKERPLTEGPVTKAPGRRLTPRYLSEMQLRSLNRNRGDRARIALRQTADLARKVQEGLGPIAIAMKKAGTLLTQEGRQELLSLRDRLVDHYRKQALEESYKTKKAPTITAVDAQAVKDTPIGKLGDFAVELEDMRQRIYERHMTREEIKAHAAEREKWVEQAHNEYATMVDQFLTEIPGNFLHSMGEVTKASKAKSRTKSKRGDLENLNDILEGYDPKGVAEGHAIADPNIEYEFDIQRHKRYMNGLKEKLRKEYDQMVQDSVEEGLSKAGAPDRSVARNEVVDNILKELPAMPEAIVPPPSTLKVSAKGFTPKSRKLSAAEEFLAKKAAELGKSAEELGVKPAGKERKKAGSYATWEGERRMANRLTPGGQRLVSPHISALGKRPGFEASLYQIGEEGGKIKGGPKLEKAAKGDIEVGKAGIEAKAVEGMTSEEKGEGVKFGFTPPDPFRQSSIARYVESQTRHSQEVIDMMKVFNETAAAVHRGAGAKPQLAKGARKPTSIPHTVAQNMKETLQKLVNIAKTATGGIEVNDRVEGLVDSLVADGDLAPGQPAADFTKAAHKYLRKKLKELGTQPRRLKPEEYAEARREYEEKRLTPRQRAERTLGGEFMGEDATALPKGAASTAKKKTIYEEAGEADFRKNPPPLNIRNQHVREGVRHVENISNALKMGITGGDISLTFRQALALTARTAIHEPRKMLKILEESVKSYSADRHAKYAKELQKDPDYQNAIDAGLRLNRELSDNDHFQISDALATFLAKKEKSPHLPVRLLAHATEKYAIGANRAYTHMQNRLMLNAWKTGRNMLAAQKMFYGEKKIGKGGLLQASSRTKEGADWMKKEGYAIKEKSELGVQSVRELTDMINMFGSRSKIKTEAIARIGNIAAFSGQMIKSNLKMLANAGLPFEKGIPERLKPLVSGGRMYESQTVREFGHEHVRDMAGFAGGIMALTYLGAAAAGLKPEIETDPRSNDFAKVRFGTTTVNPLGPFQQYIRSGAQMLSGQEKLRGSGRVQEANRADILARLVRGKAAPLTGLMWTLFTGKTGAGREAETASGKMKAIIDTVSPMAPEDAFSILKAHPDALGVYLTALATLGSSVQAGSPGKPWISDAESRDTDVRVSDEIRRLKLEPPRVGTRVPLTGRNPLGQKHYYSLSGAEREQFETEVMPIISKDLDTFISSETYKKLPDAAKRRALYNAIKRENKRYSTSKRLRQKYAGMAPVNEWWQED